uniref:Uncharacterized protein n=1 Tax=Myotis myotis TaxID=51298 RepID=A0A7J7RSP6_MYOMY|nr:hypothetical protein mMyoMyo1_010233 [Myotis myotis]
MVSELGLDWLGKQEEAEGGPRASWLEWPSTACPVCAPPCKAAAEHRWAQGLENHPHCLLPSQAPLTVSTLPFPTRVCRHLPSPVHKGHRSAVTDENKQRRSRLSAAISPEDQGQRRTLKGCLNSSATSTECLFFVFKGKQAQTLLGIIAASVVTSRREKGLLQLKWIWDIALL